LTLRRLAATLDGLKSFSVSKDYRVVTVSINPEDHLAWAGCFESQPGKVLVSHGEESVSLEFAESLRSRLGWAPEVPHPGVPIPL
ncbi:MAG: hypothetical protein H6Q84_2851, partial [Deltaproteobacteria bacterium]|nr:hypothetical protein [Deltaproteobacteria bacterium]